MNQFIKDRVNQLEENYHFNLEKFSFIYREKKAFILDIKENIKLIYPFSIIRKNLGDQIDELVGDKFQFPKQMNNYLYTAMEIIGNMLDHQKMGSVEAYLNHIWNQFDEAVNANTPEEMQKFVNLINDIVTMIDYCVETQLSKFDNRKGLIQQSMMENLFPDMKIAGMIEIGSDGKIQKVIKSQKPKTHKSKSDKFNIKTMKPINSKEI